MITMTETAGVGSESPRRLILSAATTVFAADGYNAASLNTIAELATMSRQRLLHYFPSKRRLLIAVLEDRDERLTFHLDVPESIDLQEFIALLDGLVPAIYADNDLMQLAHRLTAEATKDDHPAHGWVQQRQRRIRAEIAAVLRSLIQRRELPSWLNADAFAGVLLGAIEGIEGQRLVDSDWDHTAAIATLRSLVGSLALPQATE